MCSRSLTTICVIASCAILAEAYHQLSPTHRNQPLAAFSADRMSRRGWIEAVSAGAVVQSLVVAPDMANAATEPTTPSPRKSILSSGKPNGLASRLAQRDPALLQNRLFNVPPASTVYPDFLRGDWKLQTSFNGYIFPSQTIPRDRLVKNVLVPGFQKCSIAATSDVGLDKVACKWSVNASTGLVDVTHNWADCIDAYLGYKAVQQVQYDPRTPNRCSIDFVDYKTINAERLELFCNARESELVTAADAQVFVCSEFYRQVTFGTGQDVGVPRQVVTNYAHFWTYTPDLNGGFTGNLLTAAYLDPQDPMFFDEPSKPVAVYSHTIKGQRV